MTSILDWPRAGYPQGVPPTDHFPLLALLHRGLSPDEVRSVAEELARAGYLDTWRPATVTSAG